MANTAWVSAQAPKSETTIHPLTVILFILAMALGDVSILTFSITQIQGISESPSRVIMTRNMAQRAVGRSSTYIRHHEILPSETRESLRSPSCRRNCGQLDGRCLCASLGQCRAAYKTVVWHFDTRGTIAPIPRINTSVVNRLR